MKILSLFDGMSVAQQALKDAGIPVETYYASEIDEYAKAVTQSNFPDTTQLGSVVGLELNEGIDLMIGGSPCQDLSIAKKNRKGLDGSRSGLFWEYVRIRDEVKPKYFILENVASMPKEAKEVISEALGVQPIMINASLVSAQNRKRLFWVGKFSPKTGKYEPIEISQPEDKGILLKDILESEVDEKYFLDKDFTLTPSTNNDIAGTLDTGTWSKRYEQIRRVYKPSAKSPTIPTGTGGGVITKVAVPVALRNRGQGKKPEYNNTGKANAMTTVQSDSMVEVKAITMSGTFGNRRIAKSDKAYCLAANPSSDQNPKVEIDTQIRKLTPTECLRLQSMPDDYFEKAIYKNKPISNTQRYKMCGNAFNKEVIVHILKELTK